ncbi:hypothetical protein GE09DRAFT_621912 [Coniochaeta sp. 2T2.1]|nr:hypothetical protein GE09DRAFT_621912 [Coniochaeta sp. 2T2.1]
MNQSFRSLGECALSSKTKGSSPGVHVLRMASNCSIASPTMGKSRKGYALFGSWTSSSICRTCSLCRTTRRPKSPRQSCVSFRRWKFLFSMKNRQSLQTLARVLQPRCLYWVMLPRIMLRISHGRKNQSPSVGLAELLCAVPWLLAVLSSMRIDLRFGCVCSGSVRVREWLLLKLEDINNLPVYAVQAGISRCFHGGQVDALHSLRGEFRIIGRPWRLSHNGCAVIGKFDICRRGPEGGIGAHRLEWSRSGTPGVRGQR